MTSTAIEKKALTQLVSHPGADRPIPAFLTSLPWAADDDEAINDIIAGILGAPTIDAALTRPSTVPFEDFMGTTFQIVDFKMRGSDLEEGIGAYAIMAVVRATDHAEMTTTTSALGVLAQLARIHAEDGFPIWVTLQEVEQNKKGRNNPLYLAKRDGDF